MRGLDARSRLPATRGGLPVRRRSHAMSSEVAPRPAVAPDTILYGVAYYHEYMAYEGTERDSLPCSARGV